MDATAHRRFTAFAIKAAVNDFGADTFTFLSQKTMYGGNGAVASDRIFLFASEREGGHGLFACGMIHSSEPVPRTAAARQTPRLSITVQRTGTATRRLGRSELRAFRARTDSVAEAELDFKLYRQATNKIIGLTDTAAGFLDRFFQHD